MFRPIVLTSAHLILWIFPRDVINNNSSSSLTDLTPITCPFRSVVFMSLSPLPPRFCVRYRELPPPESPSTSSASSPLFEFAPNLVRLPYPFHTQSVAWPRDQRLPSQRLCLPLSTKSLHATSVSPHRSCIGFSETNRHPRFSREYNFISGLATSTSIISSSSLSLTAIMPPFLVDHKPRAGFS